MNWFEFIYYDLYGAILNFSSIMVDLFFTDINIPLFGTFTFFEIAFGVLLVAIITRAIIRSVSL